MNVYTGIIRPKAVEKAKTATATSAILKDTDKKMTLSPITYAHQVFNRTKALSIKVNKELLEPMSLWLDDPDFMDRHKVIADIKERRIVCKVI